MAALGACTVIIVLSKGFTVFSSDFIACRETDITQKCDIVLQPYGPFLKITQVYLINRVGITLFIHKLDIIQAAGSGARGIAHLNFFGNLNSGFHRNHVFAPVFFTGTSQVYFAKRLIEIVGDIYIV